MVNEALANQASDIREERGVASTQNCGRLRKRTPHARVGMVTALSMLDKQSGKRARTQENL